MKNGRGQLKLSVLEKAYRESKDLTEERQGQTLDVHFREVSTL